MTAELESDRGPCNVLNLNYHLFGDILNLETNDYCISCAPFYQDTTLQRTKEFYGMLAHYQNIEIQENKKTNFCVILNFNPTCMLPEESTYNGFFCTATLAIRACYCHVHKLLITMILHDKILQMRKCDCNGAVITPGQCIRIANNLCSLAPVGYRVTYMSRGLQPIRFCHAFNPCLESTFDCIPSIVIDVDSQIRFAGFACLTLPVSSIPQLFSASLDPYSYDDAEECLEGGGRKVKNIIMNNRSSALFQHCKIVLKSKTKMVVLKLSIMTWMIFL